MKFFHSQNVSSRKSQSGTYVVDIKGLILSSSSQNFELKKLENGVLYPVEVSEFFQGGIFKINYAYSGGLHLGHYVTKIQTSSRNIKVIFTLERLVDNWDYARAAFMVSDGSLGSSPVMRLTLSYDPVTRSMSSEFLSVSDWLRSYGNNDYSRLACITRENFPGIYKPYSSPSYSRATNTEIRKAVNWTSPTESNIPALLTRDSNEHPLAWFLSEDDEGIVLYAVISSTNAFDSSKPFEEFYAYTYHFSGYSKEDSYIGSDYPESL